MIKNYFKLIFNTLPVNSSTRWILAGFYHNPGRFIYTLYSSLIATKRLAGGFFPILVRVSPGQSLKVRRHPKSNVIMKGLLLIESWGGLEDYSTIVCGQGSTLEVLNDFVIGPDVHLSLSPGAKLVLGGKDTESASVSQVKAV